MNLKHKSVNPTPAAPDVLKNLQRRVGIQLGALLVTTIIIVGLAAFVYGMAAQPKIWWPLGVGISLIMGLALWLVSRILKLNLSPPMAEQSGTSDKDGASYQLGQIDNPADDGHDHPVEAQTLPAKSEEIVNLNLTEPTLEELRRHFCQQAQTDFEGVAVHQKINILAANQMLAELFGYSPTELTGMTLLDLVTPESRSTVLRNTVIKYERPYLVVGQRRDGSTLPIELLSLAITYQDQVVRLLGLRAAHTQEQANILWQLQQAKEALESKVKAGGTDLKDTNERLKVELHERQRAEAELLQRYRELTILQAAGLAITSSLDLRYVLDTVAQEMVKLLNVESCAISEFNRDDDTVVKVAEYHASQGWWDSNLPANPHHLADYPVIRAVLEEQVVEQMTIQQTYLDPAELAFMQQHQLKTLLLMPMVFQRHVVGLVELADSRVERAFSHQEIAMAKLLANQAASAIENARLYQKAQQEIVERKQAEAALAEERALLAQRVRERTAELSKANAELARVARLKDEFLAAMSHELRTPLHAILGSAEILREKIFGDLNEKQLKYAQNVEEGGRHLLELINDILDLSKIEAGKMELELMPTSVRSVSEASVRLVKQLAHKKQLQLTYTIDDGITSLLADERRLKQILVNLLSNAIKFTPEGGQIGLEVKKDLAQEAVHFTVWDTGIGIAPEDLARLFQPFVQLDSKLARQYYGTGLGLSLVSRMTEMHGGGISVESEVGRGSRFTVSLPWARPTETSPPAAELDELVPAGVGQAGAKQPLILLADDNEDNINLVVDYLAQQSYQIIIARNGQEAIALAQEERPDLILMDVQMPGMDGLEATRRLRAETAFATTPIIVVTALAMPGDRERCLASGANEYLSKPLNLRGLVRTIETELNHYRVERGYSL